MKENGAELPHFFHAVFCIYDPECFYLCWVMCICLYFSFPWKPCFSFLKKFWYITINSLSRHFYYYAFSCQCHLYQERKCCLQVTPSFRQPVSIPDLSLHMTLILWWHCTLGLTACHIISIHLYEYQCALSHALLFFFTDTTVANIEGGDW